MSSGEVSDTSKGARRHGNDPRCWCAPFLSLRYPTIEPTIFSPTGLADEHLDADAYRSVQWLQRRGFEAYLVGGCVRDLLLGLEPKDFDIATSARPPQVKRVFPRNCRIIGRRFKLAHLHYHQNTKILECSTFRRSPSEERSGDDLLITQDNEFGTAEEDALRRDFTINALFFDPLQDRILDWTGGLEDLRARLIRTIGDPIVRFREDPVRILRAAKFAGRLGFHIDAPTLDAMAMTAQDLNRAAPPRVLEEILRLLRTGHALDCFQILRDIGALKVLMPVVGEFLATADERDRVVFWHLLDALDGKVRNGVVPSNPVLLGTLFARPVAEACRAEPDRAPATIAESLLGPFASALRLPRRDSGCLKRICGVLGRFRAQSNRRFRVQAFLRDPYFDEALELFELHCLATGEGTEELEEWQRLASQSYDPEARERFPAEDDEPRADDAEEPEAEREPAGEPDASPYSGDEPPASEETAWDAMPPAAADADREPRRRRRGRRGRRGPREDEAREPAAHAPSDAAPQRAERGPAPRSEPLPEAAFGDELHDGEPVPEARGDEPREEDARPAARGELPIPESEFKKLSRSARRRRLRKLRKMRQDGSAPEGEGETELPSGPESSGEDGAAREEWSDEAASPAAAEQPRHDASSHEGQPAQRQDREDDDRRGRRRRRRRRGRGGDRDGEPREAATQTEPPADSATERTDSPEPERAFEDRPADAVQAEGQAPQRPPQRPPERHEPRRHERDARGKQPSRDEGRRGRRRDRGKRGGREQEHRGGAHPRDRRGGKVDVIEPELVDRTAFEVELDPTRAPTFGAGVENQTRKKSPIRRVLLEEDKDPYKPPPPPDLNPSGAPPPVQDEPEAGGGGGTFGDW